MKLLAIDPGTERSAYALIRADYTIVSAAKDENRNVLRMVRAGLDCKASGVLKDLNGIERIVWARCN